MKAARARGPALHAGLVAEDRAAASARGRIDRQHRQPPAAVRDCMEAQPSISVDLPTPGAAGQADPQSRPRPPAAPRRNVGPGDRGRGPALDSISVMARASARRSPSIRRRASFRRAILASGDAEGFGMIAREAREECGAWLVMRRIVSVVRRPAPARYCA